MNDYTVRVLTEDCEIEFEVTTDEANSDSAYEHQVAGYIDTESPFYPGDPFYTVQLIDPTGNVLSETNSAIAATKSGRNFH